MSNLPPRKNESMEWYQKMYDVYKNSLSDDEKKQLTQWEEENLGAFGKATSDWPGWVKYIGSPPWRAE